MLRRDTLNKKPREIVNERRQYLQVETRKTTKSNKDCNCGQLCTGKSPDQDLIERYEPKFGWFGTNSVPTSNGIAAYRIVFPSGISWIIISRCQGESSGTMYGKAGGY